VWNSEPLSIDRSAFLSRLLTGHGYVLPNPVISGLALYFDELFFWNRRINLTGALSEEELMAKHMGDTLFLHEALPYHAQTALDIGTGAGIPGLILKLIRPSLVMFLADARRKRISFLKNVIGKLGLQGVFAEQCIISKDVAIQAVFQTFPAQGVDVVLSQAVCSIGGLASMARPLMAKTGCIVSMKGPRYQEELAAAATYLKGVGLTYDVRSGKNPLNGHERFLVILHQDGV